MVPSERCSLLQLAPTEQLCLLNWFRSSSLHAGWLAVNLLQGCEDIQAKQLSAPVEFSLAHRGFDRKEIAQTESRIPLAYETVSAVRSFHGYSAYPCSRRRCCGFAVCSFLHCCAKAESSSPGLLGASLDRERRRSSSTEQ